MSIYLRDVVRWDPATAELHRGDLVVAPGPGGDVHEPQRLPGRATRCSRAVARWSCRD